MRVGHRQLSIPITPLRECVRGFSFVLSKVSIVNCMIVIVICFRYTTDIVNLLLKIIG